MPRARPWVREAAGERRVPGLSPREVLELLCLSRGAHADERPRAARERWRLEAAGLVRTVTGLAPDGREVHAGYVLTDAGLRHVERLRAEAAAERDGGEIAGGSDGDAPEVADRERLHRPCPPITADTKEQHQP